MSWLSCILLTSRAKASQLNEVPDDPLTPDPLKQPGSYLNPGWPAEREGLRFRLSLCPLGDSVDPLEINVSYS